MEKVVTLMENKDNIVITEEEIRSFYKSAGIVINELSKRIKNFRLTSNYKNLIYFSNVHNGEQLKNNLVRYFQVYSDKFYNTDVRYNENLVNVIGKGNFKLGVKEYRDKYEHDFLMECNGMSVNK